MQFVSLNRIVIGLLMGAITLSAAYFGSWIWAAFVLLLSILGFREYKFLCNKLGAYPSWFWPYVFLVLFILVPVLQELELVKIPVFLYQALLVALTFLVIFVRMLFSARETRFENAASSVWGILHLGFLPSFFVWIRGLEQGLLALMIVLIVVSLNDVAALVFGRAFGRTPLSPRISPKKTVEGSLGGLLVATLVFTFSMLYFGFDLRADISAQILQLTSWSLDLINVLSFVVLGLMFGIISQIGDLLESVFKRRAGVKDSGDLLRSHGGILDRVDSHYLTAWFGYLVFKFLV